MTLHHHPVLTVQMCLSSAVSYALVVIIATINFCDTSDSTRIWDNPYTAQVRLTRGATVNQGLVEVYCSGQWGTVCDNSFDQNDADTICRQIGYYQAMRFNHLSM